jgi:BD-FAE protein
MKAFWFPAVAVGLLVTVAVAQDPAAKPKAPESKPPQVSEKVSPIEVINPQTTDKRTALAVVRKPPGKGPFPTMICIHGGGKKESVEKLKQWSREVPTVTRFLTAGYVVVMATFHGQQDDPQSPKNLADLLAIIEHVKKMPEVDARSVVVWGISAGGSYALELAGETTLCAVAVEEPGAGLICGVFTKETWEKLGDKPPYKGTSVRPILKDPEPYITDAVKKQAHEKVSKISCPVFYADRAPFKINDLVLIPELKKIKPKLEMKRYVDPELQHGFSVSHEPFFTDCDAFFRKYLKTQPKAIKLD